MRSMDYSAKKERKVEVFLDTERWCRSHPTLVATIKNSISHTKYYPAEAQVAVPQSDKQTKVSVSRNKSLQAAYDYLAKNPNARVCVHNFASATNPGGGVRWGSSAQEECLCRCTTLLPCLLTDDLYKKYYEFHRKRRDQYYTDAVIYTPDVMAIKSDLEFPERLEEKDWRKVDMLTCAAPNLRDIRNPDLKELKEIHIRRAEKIISAAADNNADILITGAFGCGAFKNPPTVVASAWKIAIQNLRGALKEIEFAVYCSSPNDANYWAFKGEFAR